MSGKLAVGYDAETTTYVVYLMSEVIVVARCVGWEGEGGG